MTLAKVETPAYDFSKAKSHTGRIVLIIPMTADGAAASETSSRIYSAFPYAQKEVMRKLGPSPVSGSVYAVDIDDSLVLLFSVLKESPKGFISHSALLKALITVVDKYPRFQIRVPSDGDKSIYKAISKSIPKRTPEIIVHE